MPDRAGAFLWASRVIYENGGSIKRISYNKAVDAHTLFIDVSAEEEKLEEIAKGLYSLGYLSYRGMTNVLLLSIKVKQQGEGITLPLKVIEKYKINISYISAAEEKEDKLKIKLGVLVENTAETVNFLNELSHACDIKVVKNDITEKQLDNTVFYIGFANDIRRLLNLNQQNVNDIIISSNKIMHRLEEKGENPIKTFEYIKKFAAFTAEHKGKNFCAKIYSKEHNNYTIYMIEPPCGSNTYILEINEKLLFVDCGFACFRSEMLNIFDGLFENFAGRRKILFLTHCDMDHAGLCDIFDEIYASKKTFENFCLESKGEENFREQYIHHEPYNKICEIISEYKTPDIKKIKIISENNGGILEKTGEFSFEDENFDIYEGNGGHVPGECVLVWEKEKTAFSGDIFVNAKGYSKEQAEFNAFAPYLTTSVNIDSEKALLCRKRFTEMFKSYFICPGHGKWCKK